MPRSYHRKDASGAPDPVADLLMKGRVIAYHAELAHVTGSVNAGLLLSQFYFWTGTLPPEREGWFYKSRDDILAETGLSRTEQENARKRLSELGILEQERRGVPARMWYRIDKGRIYGLLKERANKLAGNLPTGGRETSQPEGGNGTGKGAGNPPALHAENTPEKNHIEIREGEGKEILRRKMEELKRGAGK